VDWFNTPSPIDRWTGYCFRSICFFLSFFVPLLARLRENGCTDLYESFMGRCRVALGRPDSILGQFRKTARCPHANFFYIVCQHYEQTAGPICMKFSGKVWSDHGTTWLHFSSIPSNRTMPRCATRGRGLLCFNTTAFFQLSPNPVPRTKPETKSNPIQPIIRSAMTQPNL